MFKRFIPKFRRPPVVEPERPSKIKGTVSVNKLDPNGEFQLTFPIIFNVAISPLDTFTERAFVEYEKAAKVQLEVVRNSILQPLSDGTLRVYPPKREETAKKGRN